MAARGGARDRLRAARDARRLDRRDRHAAADGEDPARASRGARRRSRRTACRRAARAIMTTDTVPKQRRAHASGSAAARVTIAGIAKGVGHDRAEHGDDALVPRHRRRGRARRRCAASCARAADASYNQLTVDGESSTSDTVLLLRERRGRERGDPERARAGRRGASPRRSRRSCVDLVRAARARRRGRDEARDGARARARARRSRRARAAKRIANSVLVKTALFGGDPNWGRVLQTIGAGRIDLDLAQGRGEAGRASPSSRRGRSAGPGARKRARRGDGGAGDRRRRRPRRAGAARRTVWTCDLSYDYVKINAEYTT